MKHFKTIQTILGVIVFTIMLALLGCQNQAIAPENTVTELKGQSSQMPLSTTRAQRTLNGGGHHVMLQGFHWDSARVGNWYNIMAQNSQKMKDAGITLVWSPPPWRDESQWGTGAGTWGGKTGGGGEGYFWYRFNLNSKYGSENDLNNMISTLGSKGIKVIVDVVANHAHRFHSNPQWPVSSNKWRANAWEDGYVFAEDSEINTGNAYHDILNALNVLRGKGVVGWRYDVCHGFPVGRTAGWNNDTNAEFSVGEYDWSGHHPIAGYLEDWCDAANSTGFDFYEKFNLNSANASKFGGLHTNERAEARARAVTFVENHDSQASRGNGNNAPDDSMGARSKCYAWILATPGTPCVYWPDLMDNGVGYNWLKSMIWVRKNAGIRADSAILYNETNGSGRAAVIKGTNHNIAIALDWPDWKPSGDFTFNSAASGWNGYMNVWTGTGTGGGGGGGGGGGEIGLYITVDVGHGNAVFFTGGCDALTNWGTGIQGTWYEGNVWGVKIKNPGKGFGWKVRLGSHGGSGGKWENDPNHGTNDPPQDGDDYHPGFNGWQ